MTLGYKGFKIRIDLTDNKNWYVCILGQVSVQRAMLMVKQMKSKCKESVDGYIEEGIIRRELADNFCFYNNNYDKIEGKLYFLILSQLR